jgi:hypothetical protein
MFFAKMQAGEILIPKSKNAKLAALRKRFAV